MTAQPLYKDLTLGIQVTLLGLCSIIMFYFVAVPWVVCVAASSGKPDVMAVLLAPPVFGFFVLRYLFRNTVAPETQVSLEKTVVELSETLALWYERLWMAFWYFASWVLFQSLLQIFGTQTRAAQIIALLAVGSAARIHHLILYPESMGPTEEIVAQDAQKKKDE